MQFLAVLQTDTYEWVSLSNTEAQARQNVFDGFNTYLMRQFEFEWRGMGKLGDITHEYLEARLEHYYKSNFNSGVSIDALEREFEFYILELIKDECYRDGFRVPKRVQDI